MHGNYYVKVTIIAQFLDIGNKLIDSLCEANEIGEVVPENLSEAEKQELSLDRDKLYPNIQRSKKGNERSIE